MNIERFFLAWEKPALASAVEFLLDGYRAGSTLDLEHVLVVVPGGRAGKRLLELLVIEARKTDLTFLPPRIETSGMVPELLYEQERPTASDLVSRAVWKQALQEIPSDGLRPVFPHLPNDDDAAVWQTLASYLFRLNRELAADGYTFAEVLQQSRQAPGFVEPERWQALANIHDRYLQILAMLGLEDAQAARLQAIAAEKCHTDDHIVLVAVPDMGRALTQMLRQSAARITALIFAPDSYAGRFDELGCLLAETWQDAGLSIDDKQISYAQDAAGQAEQVVEWLAELNREYAADDITIGVPDEKLVPLLLGALEEYELPARWLVGQELTASRPYRLLVGLLAMLHRQGIQEFSSFVRHPDIHEWLRTKDIPAEWLIQLDNYWADHVLANMGYGQTHINVGSHLIQRARDELAALIGDIAQNTPRPADLVFSQLRNLLEEVYQASSSPGASRQDSYLFEACRQFSATLDAVSSLPVQLLPPMRPTDAIEFLLQELRGKTIPAEPNDHAIELLGWLELPLNDAPALVVTSMNERFIPSSVTGDLFLPDSLRQQLGLDDNRRRFARDAYALDVLLNTRKDLKLVVSRFDTQEQPLAPSRLLFATEATAIADRVVAMYDRPSETPAIAFPGQIVSSRGASEFTIPHPDETGEFDEIDSLRVTDFKLYMLCPYRFYLERIVGLQPRDYQPRELNALQFGNLVHSVLRGFGESPIKDSFDQGEIADHLKDVLKSTAEEYYGNHMRAAVNVQIQQAEVRLMEFARWQAVWRAQGWRILHVEQEIDDAPFDVDGLPLLLRGRIDRIDVHEGGNVAIFDYKTSAEAEFPEKTHRKRSEWVDLQLPLYRHLASAVDLPADIDLGYICLPQKIEDTGQRIANWNNRELSEADEQAREVVRRIRQREFWPPKEIPKQLDGFPAICMRNVFERPKF